MADPREAAGITEESDEEVDSIWESERIVSDSVGRLMELWGFKRNLGRVWTVLYLAGGPLTAKQLRDRLQLSSGAVSMTLSELSRWGVARNILVAWVVTIPAAGGVAALAWFALNIAGVA